MVFNVNNLLRLLNINYHIIINFAVCGHRNSCHIFWPYGISLLIVKIYMCLKQVETNYAATLYILHRLMQIHHIKHLIDHSETTSVFVRLPLLTLFFFLVPIGDRIKDVYDEAATKKHWLVIVNNSDIGIL